MDWLVAIISLITGGGIVTLISAPWTAKKAKADARAAEIDNIQKVADGWKALAEERQEANKEKDTRIEELIAQIDARYIDIGEWRDKYNAKCEEITELKVQIASNAPKICEKRGCGDRTPPTGY